MGESLGPARDHGAMSRISRRVGAITESATLKPDSDGYLIGTDGRRVVSYMLNHKRAVLFTRQEESADYFRDHGVKVNGVKFGSQGENHEVWVPNQNDIQSIINGFDEGEKRMRNPRKIQGSQGNGVLSGSGGGARTVSAPGNVPFM